MNASNSKRVASYYRRPSNHSASRTPTVCVVDPQADTYQSWDAAPEARGARLKIVASAEEALRFARSTAVDLWMVNAELPGLSGYELCGMLKGQSASAAVYLFADQYSESLEQAAYLARATGFGVRPTHRDWLDPWLEQRRHNSTPTHTS